jgi:hypothetical protein
MRRRIAGPAQQFLAHAAIEQCDVVHVFTPLLSQSMWAAESAFATPVDRAS